MDENQSTNTTQSNGGNSKKWIMIAVAVIIIVVVAAVGGFFFLNSNSSNSESDTMMEGDQPGDGAMMEGEADNSDTVMEEDGAMMEGDETSYTDGEYTAIGTYQYHSGSESIEVTLTLESGVITSSNVVSQAEHPTSKKMQDDFIANYESEVIGKNINELKLGKVSGSSLTPLGFNAAVEDIKAQAQS